MKKQFDRYENVDGFEFTLWEKYGKRRIYVNNNTGRNQRNGGGYIDLDHDNAVYASGCVKLAAERFLAAYEV